jgi:hypothetical protein
MQSSKSPLTRTLNELLTLWAKQNGFAMASPYVMVRERSDIDAKEVIEFQRSIKHPLRTYTVNLGLFHPDYCEYQPATPKDLSAMHCGREVRLGHLMTKSPWIRIARWYRYGSPWNFFELIPPYGDCWWQYGHSVEESVPSVRDTLQHLTTGGLAWFENLRQLSAITELFDQKNWAWYEFPGARAKGFGMLRKII